MTIFQSPATGLFDRVGVATAPADIALNMSAKKQRMFIGDASFNTPKNISITNANNAIEFWTQLELTDVAAVLSLIGGNFISNDVRWNSATDEFTLIVGDEGILWIHGLYDGTDWNLTFDTVFV